LDERVLNKPDLLEELWKIALLHAKSEEEVKQQMEWEKHIIEEFTKEINRAARQDTPLNYGYATVQAFQKVGIFINPDWLFDYNISGNTIQNSVELETIWDSIQRTIQKEKQIMEENIIGKEHWMQLLREAICYDKQQAYSQKTPLLNYYKAIMYSLSQTGRMINPDILTGVLTWPRKMLEKQRVIDQIWEHACLELDHERLVIKGQLTSPYQKKPEIDCRTKWSMKLREIVYSNLKEI